MASVTNTTAIATWIDDYLAYLSNEWNAVPQIAAAWDTWQDHEQLDFVVEWPIREDRWGQLQRWANEGRLSAAQSVRFDALAAVIAKYRATLEGMLAD